jgi:N-acyl-D-aspartate/D-glutamate deacylase
MARRLRGEEVVTIRVLAEEGTIHCQIARTLGVTEGALWYHLRRAVPHAAIRTYVMGKRATNHEQATPEDREEMARIAASGIRAGALGFSTSRTINHQTLTGEHTPTLHAAEEELSVIGEAIGKAKKPGGVV